MLPQKVDLVLNSIDHLRPMPSSVTRILKAIDSPNTSAGMIAEYIGLDQALTAMVLQASNSAAVGYAHDCASISDAVVRIGFKKLKAIILGLTSAGPITQRLSGYRLGAGQLWSHSLRIAVASEWVARTLHYPDPDEAYVAGLLHDIGKLLLDQYVLEDYKKIVDFVQEYHIPLWQVEEKLIGIDHATVGGLMASRWQFPVSLNDAIRYHHSPSLAHTNMKLPAIVNFANSIAGPDDKETVELASNDLHPETLNILNLREIDQEKLGDGINKVLGGSKS